MKLDAVRRVSSRLPRNAAPRQAGQWLDAAQKDLAECSAYLASQNDRSAYLLAQACNAPAAALGAGLLGRCRTRGSVHPWPAPPRSVLRRCRRIGR